MVARLVVLISGSGTNLQAVQDAAAEKQLDAEVVLVVSNRKAAHGLVRAQQAGITTLYFPLKPYLDNGQGRAVYDLHLAERVRACQPDLIVLAGWMHILSHAFLDSFPGRVINLHPSLPGVLLGADALRRTFEAYQQGALQQGGCMVHYVVPEVDAGPVITQAVVPIEAGDTLETFETRVHDTEHRLIVEAVRLALEQIQAG